MFNGKQLYDNANDDNANDDNANDYSSDDTINNEINVINFENI